MQEDDARYPDLPQNIAVHTTSFQRKGIANDPTLPEYILARMLPHVAKKRIFFGPSIVYKDLFTIRDYIARAGAMIALKDTVEPLQLMGLSCPRGIKDSNELQRPLFATLWNIHASAFDGHYKHYVSRFGTEAVTLSSILWDALYVGMEVDLFDLNAVNKFLKEKIKIGDFMSALMTTADQVFNYGIVAASTAPELCADFRDYANDNRVRLELCRQWALIWRPQFAHLFEDAS